MERLISRPWERWRKDQEGDAIFSKRNVASSRTVLEGPNASNEGFKARKGSAEAMLHDVRLKLLFRQ
jgi:hypothetical protein